MKVPTELMADLVAHFRHLPSGLRRRLKFDGTFNPPGRNHRTIAEELVRTLVEPGLVDELVIWPGGAYESAGVVKNGLPPAHIRRQLITVGFEGLTERCTIRWDDVDSGTYHSILSHQRALVQTPRPEWVGYCPESLHAMAESCFVLHVLGHDNARLIAHWNDSAIYLSEYWFLVVGSIAELSALQGDTSVRLPKHTLYLPVEANERMRDLRADIAHGVSGWEERAATPEVANLIKQHQLYGYRP